MHPPIIWSVISAGDWRSHASLFYDAPDDSTPFFPTTTGILKWFMFVRYMHTTLFLLLVGASRLMKFMYTLHTIYMHCDLFPNEHIYLKTNGRGWGNCLCINSRRGGISPTCSDNLVLTIHVNSNITQPQKLLGLDTCRTSRQAITFKNPGVRLRTSPMAVLCWSAWKKTLRQLDSVRTKFKGSNLHCAAPVEEPLQMSKTRWAAYPLSDFGCPAGHLVQHNLIA